MPTLTTTSTKVAALRTWVGAVHDNDGNDTKMRIYHDDTNGMYRGLVQWDLSSIPTNAVVNSVSITLKYDGASQSGTLTISAYKVLRDWGEGTKTLTAAASGESDWTDAKHSVDAWGTAGCDNTTTDRSSTAEASKLVTTGADWTFSPSLLTVQNWVNNPSTNYGLVIRGDEGAGTNYIYFYTDDQSGSEPQITVKYNENFPSGIYRIQGFQ